jgi:hypothetical protein
MVSDASALDRAREVLYATLLDATNTAVLVALDLPHQRVRRVMSHPVLFVFEIRIYLVIQVSNFH